MSLTARNVTANQATFDTNRQQLMLFKNTTAVGNYANISGDVESVAIGQLMGRVAATGKLVPLKSAATDGSQYPVGIMLDELTDIADAGTVDNVNIVVAGWVNEAMLVLDGSDTLDTVISGRTIRDRIAADTVGIVLKTVGDDSIFDN